MNKGGYSYPNLQYYVMCAFGKGQEATGALSNFLQWDHLLSSVLFAIKSMTLRMKACLAGVTSGNTMLSRRYRSATF